MRLLELVRCGRPVVEDKQPPGSSSSAMPQNFRRRSCRCPGATTWKPSLGVISEDGALPLSREKAQPSPAQKSVKHMDKRRARRTDVAYRDEERYGVRQPDVPDMIPAFAPTSFMF